MATVIQTSNLTKRYGPKAAVNHVSLHVQAGDIYGLIGKNGAGKTTLMRLILGLTQADEGQVSLFEGQALTQARRRVGSLIEEPGLYKGKTAFENMKAFSLLHDHVTDKEIRALLRQVGLEDTPKKVGGFSLGMRQRLGIAIALMGNPQLLVLDEPINGLDPTGIKEIRDLILQLNAQGITFLISSHLLDELGKIGTRYGMIADGALVEEIAAKDLADRCRRRLAITVNNPQKAMQALAEQMPGLQLCPDEQPGTFCVLSPVEDASPISRLLVTQGFDLYAMQPRGTTLEDYFMEKLGAAR